MLKLAEREQIFTTVFSDAQFMATALKVGYCLQDIRLKVIADFLTRLEIELLNDPRFQSGWQIQNNWKHNVFEKGERFSLSKKSWKNLYGYSLEAQNFNAKGIVLGVWKEKHMAVPAPLRAGIYTVLNEGLQTGKQSTRFDWFDEYGYTDWDNPEVLNRLHLKDEAIRHFKSQFIRMADLSEHLIDDALNQPRTPAPVQT